jgi:O-antigen/teichoic acid export membrane protein
VLSEASWTFAGQFASAAGSILLVRVLTFNLAPSEFGRLSLAMTGAMLVGQVPMAIVPSITRHYAIARDCGQLTNYLRAAVRLLVTSSVISVAVGGIAILVINGSCPPGSAELATVAISYGILRGWADALAGVANAARQRRFVAICSGMEPLLRAALVIAIFRMFAPASTPVLIAYIVAAAVMAIPLALRAFGSNPVSPAIKTAPPTSWRVSLQQFAQPFMIWGIFSWAQMGADRWAIEWFCDTAAVGRYTAVYQLGFAPLGVLSAAISQLIGPIAYQRAGDASCEKRRQSAARITNFVVRSTLLATILAFVAGMLLHQQLFAWLTTPEYQESSYLLPWMILAAGVFSAAQFACIQMMAAMRVGELLPIKVGSAVFGVGASFLGAHLGGTDGVVCGMVVTATIYFCWVMLLLRQRPG